MQLFGDFYFIGGLNYANFPVLQVPNLEHCYFNQHLHKKNPKKTEYYRLITPTAVVLAMRCPPVVLQAPPVLVTQATCPVCITITAVYGSITMEDIAFF